MRKLLVVLAFFFYGGLPIASQADPMDPAESIRILVQSSPLAGSQYYEVSKLWPQLQTGDPLSLVREPDNRYDNRAIRVEWRGRKLGYVPRAENKAVSAALDRGEKLEARISRLRDDADPWLRVEMEILLRL